MKIRVSLFLATLTLLSVTLSLPALANADAGVFTGNGQDLHQITSKTVQLVSINVTVILGRGPFLFDGTVPGMDRAEYECSFALRNLSEKEEEVQIGFPVDSEFARPSEGGNSDPSRWVLDYGFIARDEKATYHVNFVRRAKNKNPEEFGSVFVWKMKFAPKEIRTLTVQYHIPMSMGLVGTDKDDGSASSAGRALSQELMHIAYLDMAGYIISTGSPWAGNVETATFTVITGPFEQYLAVEESPKRRK